MPFDFKRLVLLTSIAAGFAADKELPKLEIRPAASYAAHQTNGKIAIGVQMYRTDDETKPVFGKNNPVKSGVLPVLVVIQNDSDQALRLDRMKVEYVAGRERVEATPAAEVKYLGGARKPKVAMDPTGRPSIKKSKNPLDSWQIEGRAFAAKMLPPGQSASGFFYFQADYDRDAKVYITGMTEASTGKEIFYFDIPIAGGIR